MPLLPMSAFCVSNTEKTTSRKALESCNFAISLTKLIIGRIIGMPILGKDTIL